MSFKLHNRCILKISENLFLLLILIGVFIGFLLGILINDKVQSSKNPSPRELAMYISFPGELFLRMLKMLILPLVVSSVIVSLAILDGSLAAKLGKRAVAYFLTTTFIAVTLAVILGSVLEPGVAKGKQSKPELPKVKNGNAVHAVFDLIRNILPDNIVEAASFSTATKFKKKVRLVDNTTTQDVKAEPGRMHYVPEKKIKSPSNISQDDDPLLFEYDGLEKFNSPNALGILFFSILFGTILSKTGEEGKPLIQFFKGLFTVTMKMVELFMWFSPIGISSIIAGKLAAMENIVEGIEGLGMYIITMIIACLLHSLVILPSTYFLMLRKNPFRLMFNVANALLTAFGTASSSATLPVCLTCLEKKHKVDKRVTQFVVPIGTIVNKDGMGIYCAVAAMYIAQSYYGRPLNFSLCVLVCLASVIASIAAATIPASGPIATWTIVLPAIGIRSADIALILAVDWFLDRLITSVNVWGNCVGSVIVEHLSRGDLISPEIGKESEESVSTCATEEWKTEVSVQIEGMKYVEHV